MLKLNAIDLFLDRRWNFHNSFIVSAPLFIASPERKHFGYSREKEKWFGTVGETFVVWTEKLTESLGERQSSPFPIPYPQSLTTITFRGRNVARVFEILNSFCHKSQKLSQPQEPLRLAVTQFSN